MGARRWVPVVALVGGVALVAASCQLTNPGRYVMTWDRTSHVDILSSTGEPLVAYVPLSGFFAPSCSDGLDNDEDTFTDYPADPNCVSADDDNEVVDGAQLHVAPQLPMDIAPHSVTVDPGQLVAPGVQRCTFGLCFFPFLVGTPGPQTVALDDDGHAVVHFPLAIDLTFNGCVFQLGDLVAELELYRLDGHARLRIPQTPVPPAPLSGNCAFVNPLVVGATFGLTVEGPILDGDGHAMQFG